MPYFRFRKYVFQKYSLNDCLQMPYSNPLWNVLAIFYRKIHGSGSLNKKQLYQFSMNAIHKHLFRCLLKSISRLLYWNLWKSKFGSLILGLRRTRIEKTCSFSWNFRNKYEKIATHIFFHCTITKKWYCPCMIKILLLKI